MSKTTFWHFRLERFVACGCYSVCGVTVTYSNRWMMGILCARQYETMVSSNHLEFIQSKKVSTEPCWAPWQSPSMSTKYGSGIPFLAFACWHYFCQWPAGSVEHGMSRRQSFLFKYVYYFGTRIFHWSMLLYIWKEEGPSACWHWKWKRNV